MLSQTMTLSLGGLLMLARCLSRVLLPATIMTNNAHHLAFFNSKIDIVQGFKFFPLLYGFSDQAPECIEYIFFKAGDMAQLVFFG